MADAANNLPSKILVVDDDPAVVSAVEQAMAKHKINVVKATNLETALYQFNQNRFDCAVIELDFGPLPGLALIQKWRGHDVQDKRLTGFIVMSSSQRTSAQDSLAKEMTDVELIAKPVKEIPLLSLLAKAMASRHKSIALEDLKERVISPLVKSGNIQKAAEKIQQMIPELGDKGRRLLLDVYEEAERWQEGFDVCKHLLESNPNDIHVVSTAGRMLMKLGKFKEAKAFLEKADQLAPQNLDRLNSMAQLYLQMKEPEKSVERFRDLVKLNPESPEYKFDVFKKLYDAGFDDHAVKFGKEVAQPMEIVRHYNNKGVLLAKEGKIQEALLEYTRAVKFHPKFKENYRIYYNMALAHMQLKSPDDVSKAQEYLAKTLELDPSFEKAKASLANLQKLASKKLRQELE